MFCASRISRGSVFHKTAPRYLKEFLNCSTWGIGTRILPLLDARVLAEWASSMALSSFVKRRGAKPFEWVHRGDDLGVKFTVFLNINFNWHFTYKYKSYWVTRLLVSWICHGCCSIYFYMHLKYRYVYVTNMERKYTEQHLSGICLLH